MRTCSEYEVKDSQLAQMVIYAPTFLRVGAFLYGVYDGQI
ncbi:hypothetical protein F3D3_2507 [Fusibacter sp. 3D3]|nr:hypothetical protein F3D3_2507 [Fusibacter sp. 3D3]